MDLSLMDFAFIFVVTLWVLVVLVAFWFAREKYMEMEERWEDDKKQ